jgi:hypothetical protein
MAPATKTPSTPKKKLPTKPVSNMSPLNHGAGKESDCSGKLSSFSSWVLFAFANDYFLLLDSMCQAPKSS